MNPRLLSLVAVAGLVLGSGQLRAQERPTAPRALLGVFVEATAPDAQPAGVRILQVTPGSPAAEAGLQRGDVIAKIDDKNIRTIEDFFGVLGSRKPGDKLKVQVVRDGKEQALTATLGERGPRVDRARPTVFLGVDTLALNPDLKARAGVAVDAGAFVAEVIDNSAAARAGVQRGDVIVGYNGKNVASPDDLREEVRKGKPNEEVTLKVARGKETKELKAKLEALPAGPPSNVGPPVRELPGPLGTLERRIEALEKRVQELEKKQQEKK
jgi:serine protease Do